MAKTRETKEMVVSTLTEELGASGSVVFADFTGINVQDITDLRKQMREAGVGFTVVKNTLLRRVFNNLEVAEEDQVYAMMEGPTALAFAEDEVTPVKLLKKFAAAHKGLPVITGGFVSGQTYQTDKMMELAEIPGREELLGRLMGSALSPIQGMAAVTSAVIRKLFYAINAVRDGKEN